jgi:hypothetical protein
VILLIAQERGCPPSLTATYILDAGFVLTRWFASYSGPILQPESATGSPSSEGHFVRPSPDTTAPPNAGEVKCVGKAREIETSFQGSQKST